MDTLTKPILTPFVVAAVPLVTGYIRLLSRLSWSLPWLTS